MKKKKEVPQGGVGSSKVKKGISLVGQLGDQSGTKSFPGGKKPLAVGCAGKRGRGEKIGFQKTYWRPLRRGGDCGIQNKNSGLSKKGERDLLQSDHRGRP